MKRPFALSAACLALAAASAPAKPPPPGSSEAFVAERLAEAGLRVGVDRQTRKIVQTATATRRVADIADAGFTKLRDELAMVAVLDAKAKIAHRLHDETTAREVTARRLGEDDAEVVRRTAATEAISKRTFLGMTVLCTAESFRAGVYSVSAAVGWSPGMEASVREQLSQRRPAAPNGTAEPSPEWKKWAENQDFAFVFGPRTFVDSKGVRRYVGIAFADIEDKTGATLLAAHRLARVKASRNLLFSVFSDLVAAELVERTLTTRDGLLEGLETDVRNRIVRRCQSKLVLDDEVFTTTAVHPLSGRRMFVSVAGVEPEKLAEMNLLENGPQPGFGSDSRSRKTNGKKKKNTP